MKRLAIEGSIITIDALGTQKEIVTTICERSADYILSLKENQSSLYQDVKLFFNDKDKMVIWDEFEETDAGQGRIEVRHCTVTSDITWLKEMHPDWKNLNSIAMVNSLRINKKTNEQTQETRYYISSLPAKAKTIERLIRSHWSIENSLHWCLDMTFREDSCRLRTDHGAENFAILRKIAFNMLKINSNTGTKKKLSLKVRQLKASLDPVYLINTLLINNL